MKEVYLIRHAEKDDEGVLTENGQSDARDAASRFPKFTKVIASDSSRTQLTARLITGVEPVVDERAGFHMAAQELSDAINVLAKEKGITFFEAADIYNDGEMKKDIVAKAEGLNILVDETLQALSPNESALIVSHDMTIAPAMELRGMPKTSIPYLSGYVIRDDKEINTLD